jgi:hypothetical protein
VRIIEAASELEDPVPDLVKWNDVQHVRGNRRTVNPEASKN